MQPCRHGHIDGALHIPCYQCRSEALEQEIESMKEQLDIREKEYQAALKHSDEWKRRAQKMRSWMSKVFAANAGCSVWEKFLRKHPEAAEWFKEASRDEKS